MRTIIFCFEIIYIIGLLTNLCRKIFIFSQKLFLLKPIFYYDTFPILTLKIFADLGDSSGVKSTGYLF